jgi:hypothetical protein
MSEQKRANPTKFKNERLEEIFETLAKHGLTDTVSYSYGECPVNGDKEEVGFSTSSRDISILFYYDNGAEDENPFDIASVKRIYIESKDKQSQVKGRDWGICFHLLHDQVWLDHHPEEKLRIGFDFTLSKDSVIAVSNLQKTYGNYLLKHTVQDYRNVHNGKGYKGGPADAEQLKNSRDRLVSIINNIPIKDVRDKLEAFTYCMNFEISNSQNRENEFNPMA